MIDILLAVSLTAFCIAAAITDMRTRRIPNALTLSGFALALVLRGVAGGPALVGGLVAAVIAFVMAVPFVAAGGLGGGDAKLLTTVGAFLGPAALPTALGVTALAGGVMAIVAAFRHGALVETLGHGRTLVKRAFGSKDATPRTLESPGALAIPYGVAIAVGAMVGAWS